MKKYSSTKVVRCEFCQLTFPSKGLAGHIRAAHKLRIVTKKVPQEVIPLEYNRIGSRGMIVEHPEQARKYPEHTPELTHEQMIELLHEPYPEDFKHMNPYYDSKTGKLDDSAARCLRCGMVHVKQDMMQNSNGYLFCFVCVKSFPDAPLTKFKKLRK